MRNVQLKDVWISTKRRQKKIKQDSRRVIWSCPNLVSFSAVITSRIYSMTHVDGAVVWWVRISPDSPVVAGSIPGRRTKFNNIYLRHMKQIDSWWIDTEGREDGRRDRQSSLPLRVGRCEVKNRHKPSKCQQMDWKTFKLQITDKSGICTIDNILDVDVNLLLLPLPVLM